MERYYFESQRECKKIVIFDYHIVRKTQICRINNLTSKKLYLILADANIAKTTAQDYFEKLFEAPLFDWRKKFFGTRNTTFDAKARVFQYKILNDILQAHKILCKFGKVTYP